MKSNITPQVFELSQTLVTRAYHIQIVETMGAVVVCAGYLNCYVRGDLPGYAGICSRGLSFPNQS